MKQKIALTALRFVVYVFLFLFLLSPMIYYFRKYTERPTIVMLRDNSLSMQIEHANKQKARILEPVYTALSKSYKEAGYIVKEHFFSDGLNGDKNSTFFLPSLEKLRTGNTNARIKNIIVFSDGWFRDTDLNVLKSYDVPITTVIDTTRDRNTDIQIIDLRHNRQGYRNELSIFEADLNATGYNGSAEVTFFIDDKEIKGKNVSFANQSINTVVFENRFSKVGLHKIGVKVKSTFIKERVLSNNEFSSAIDILNDKERILLLTDAPNWDNKFILDAIRENNRWQPQSYTVKGRDLYLGEKRATIENLDNVSVIIIINQGSIQLDSGLTQKIMNKVNQGTGLIFFGLPIAQFNDLLPLKLSNIRSSYQGLFKLLPSARAYSAIQIPEDEQAQIPPVDYYYVSSSAQSEILATMDNAQKSPAIALNNQNSGKVISFSFINLWRWQLQSKTQAYRNFIADLIVWMSNKTTGQLSAQYNPSYFTGEPIEIKLTALDELRKIKQNLSPRITVFNSKNDSVYSDIMLISNNDYKAQFRLFDAGTYQFIIKDKSSNKSMRGNFIVQSQNMESRDLGFNLPLLSWISLQTKGELLNLENAAKFKPIKAVELSRTEKKEFPLYKKWYLISLFILLFCCELFLRRRWGLL